MARGRPTKSGKRHPNGRRAYEPTYDKGTEWVQAMRQKYQTHYNTALGRAYAAHLLADDEATSLDLYQGGKRFARVYNRVIGGETYRCALDRTPRGSLTETETTEQDQKDRDWLFAAMAFLDNAGLRQWLDQLITRAHTDAGPAWLDRLLDGGADPADKMRLKAAISALEIVAPPQRKNVIVSKHWDTAA